LCHSEQSRKKPTSWPLGMPKEPKNRREGPQTLLLRTGFIQTGGQKKNERMDLEFRESGGKRNQHKENGL